MQMNSHFLAIQHYRNVRLTLVHNHKTASQKSNTVGGLVVVEVLKSPATVVWFLIHVAWSIPNHLQETLLLNFTKVIIQEVICRSEANQRVSYWNLIPRSIFHHPERKQLSLKLRNTYFHKTSHSNQRNSICLARKKFVFLESL